MTPRFLTRRELKYLLKEDCAPAHVVDFHAVPMVVLSDNVSSWLSWKIKRHTHGFYNHAMILHKLVVGKSPWVATQDMPLFRERPLSDYLKGGHRLKFWVNTSWTPSQKEGIKAACRLKGLRKWYRRLYDFPGVLGQWLGLKGLQAPHAQFCSEWVAAILRETGERVEAQPSPADLNRYFKAHDDWEVWGYFDPEIEVDECD